MRAIAICCAGCCCIPASPPDGQVVPGLAWPRCARPWSRPACAGVNAYLFASLYGVAKRVAASAVLVATALSIRPSGSGWRAALNGKTPPWGGVGIVWRGFIWPGRSVRVTPRSRSTDRRRSSSTEVSSAIEKITSNVATAGSPG